MPWDGRCTSLNYASEHWVRKTKIRQPVGLILCAQKDEAVARYAGGLPNKVMASALMGPADEKVMAEIERTQASLEERKSECVCLGRVVQNVRAQ